MHKIGEIRCAPSISLLGPVLITGCDQQAVKFRSSRVQALLIYLVTEDALGETGLRRERIMSLLWPDYPQKSAQVNLRQALYQLQKTFREISTSNGPDPTPLLLTTRQTVQINPEYAIELDVSKFERLLNGPHEQWSQAIDLYRGDFLSDFYLPDSEPFEEWASARRAAFRLRFLDSLDTLTLLKIEQEKFNEAEGYARQQLEIERYRESAYRQLMTILTFTGRRSEALVLYETCRELLRNELDVDPSTETFKLYENIRSGQLAGSSESSIILRSEKEELADRIPKHNLSPQPTPFVGRNADLEALGALISDPDKRLITIVGSGGMGKTRLAIAAAEHQLVHGGAFVDGVYFVPLAPICSPDEIVPATAEALDFQFETGKQQTRTPKQQLLDYLCSKKLLLLMDNFEHLMDVVSLLSDILREAARVQIIVTSRERLRTLQEQVYPIEGLEFPDDFTASLERGDITEYPAVELFIQSARRIQPNFKLLPNETPSLARICRLVEGMPLGLELAASWVNVLSLADIAAEIQSSLDFLHTDELDFPRRQHNIRAVFDSTWDRLSGEERQVFSRFSVFRGGCTCEAAQSITGATLPMLAILVNRSLLRYDQEDDRYQIHELLRQYAAEKLAKTTPTDTQVRDQHSAYYCRWIREQEADFRSEAHQSALIAIESEVENIRVAWMWAVERVNLEQIQDAADMMGNFYQQGGLYQQGEHAFQLAAKALNGSAPFHRVYIKILTWQSVFSDRLGQSEKADQLLEKCLDLLDSPVLEDQDVRAERAFVYQHKGYLYRDADPDLAITFLQKSLDLYRELDDGWNLSDVLRILGNLARFRGAYEDAEKMLKEALEIRQEYGNCSEIARNMSDLSHVAHFQGKYVEAERLVRKAFEIYMAEGDWYSSVIGRISLGNTLLSSNNVQEGYILLLESIELLQKRGDVQLLALATINVGRALLHLGKYEEAYDTGQKGLSLYREIGPWAHAGLPLLYLSWEALGKRSYEEAEQLANEAAEANKELGDIARECASLAILGFAQLGLGKIRESQSSIFKAVQKTTNIGAFYPLILASSAMALHLLLEGENERGIELYSLVSRYQDVSGSRWFEDAVGQQIEAAAAHLPEESVTASKKRGRSLDLWQTAVDLLEELAERGWITNFPE